MGKKIFGIFTTDKLQLIHYILLTGALFLGFYFGETYLNLSKLSLSGMFIFWLAVIYLSDQIIHKVLRI
jgi:hypothetical protein